MKQKKHAHRHRAICFGVYTFDSFVEPMFTSARVYSQKVYAFMSAFYIVV